MSWIPKFRYPATSGTVLTLTLNQRFWLQTGATVGGHREAASGGANVAAFKIRRDRKLNITLRFIESEYDNVETMIEWMQDNPATAFDWWPEVGTAGTFYPSYLRSPVIGQDFVVNRNQEQPGEFETTLTIIRSTGAAWPLVWYP